MNQVEIKRRQIEMCTRIPGMITLLILGNIVGDNGIAYIAAALDAFLLFWTLTGSEVADVLGRMLRGRSVKGQYKNVAKMRRMALQIECAVGLAGSAIMLLLAGLIAQKVFRIPYCAPIIMILAPAVFFRTISSVLLGYFQGEGAELPTVISALIRQALTLVLGILFSRLFRGYGEKVSMLLKQENYTAMYGGMGVALAVSAAEAVILLFLILVFWGSKGNFRKSGAGMRVTDSFGNQVYMLYGNLFPRISAGIMRIFPMALGLIFYQKAFGASANIEKYGILYGKYMALCGICIFPISALLLSACFKTVLSLRRDEQRFARNHFWGGLHIGVAHSLFAAMACTVLAPQLAATFCKTDPKILEEMLRSGSVVIVLAVLSGYFTELLMQMNGKYLVMGMLAIYDIIFTIAITVMLNGGKMDIMAFIYAEILAKGLYTAAAALLVCYQMRCGLEWLQGLAVPAGVVCVTGLITMFVGKKITPHLGNPTTAALCIIGAAVFYWGGLILLRNFRGTDSSYLPGGTLLYKIGRRLRFR